MTPKEKAEELFVKYNEFNYETIVYSTQRTKAKECALIAVDEILKQFDGLHKPEYCAFDCIGERKFTFKSEYPEHMTGYDMVEYWQQVKEEIEKL